MKSKISYEYVKKCFEEKDCVLLENKYVNAVTRMKFICKKNHITEICWSNFRRGHGCIICGYKKTRKLSYDYVKTYFEEHGCKLLETEYEGSNSKMKYLCSCGREAITIWSRFSQGHRCRKCFNERHSEKMRNPDREIIKLNKTIARRSNAMVRRVLKGLRKVKKSKCIDILGYSTTELKNHLQNHSNWPSIVNKMWSIDHIFPIKAFVEHGITDMSIINSLDNLQPLLLSENISKSDKYCEKDFFTWLKNHNVVVSF